MTLDSNRTSKSTSPLIKANSPSSMQSDLLSAGQKSEAHEGRGGRGDDAVDVERVTGVLAVHDLVVDQRLLVLDPGLLRKVDHRVRILLLRTGICVGGQRVDPAYPRKQDARVVLRVAAWFAALHAQILPALCDSA